ncbi:hypothetical protein MSKOL_2885 [Methanosarcina sp. Kolksee]|uniref:hypothetical protein n=1 Tax=Methanosarcina sp. Kolksee TaxID=1434099 RepID=UPI000615FD6F|nr:hypothetical protein [Methanosarcina sp. Kolksee]AKB48662.1 hypothetical protein MSKOL_2885 [Methanosarcina sp. Kolksee]
MKRLNLFSILFTLMLLLLAPNIAAALLAPETAEIPYQINNSDRIVIGTVSKIIDYGRYTIITIAVNEWLYNPLPAKTIKVRIETGSSHWTEDEAEFTKNESVLIMLKDVDIDKQLFKVTFGFPGKRPTTDRDAVIEELKAQGKWPEENQIGNKTNETEVIENIGTVEKQEENQTENKTNENKTNENKTNENKTNENKTNENKTNENKTNETGITENTEITGEQEESSNQTQKPNTTPFMSSVSAIAVMLGAIVYLKRKN